VSDPKKLPVLYGIRNELEVAVDLKPYAVHLQMVRESDSDVEYEPAVPRCRTCEHYNREYTECKHLLNEREGYLEMSPDDYCSQHPEANRG
jgi:hypothetical protein